MTAVVARKAYWSFISGFRGIFQQIFLWILKCMQKTASSLRHHFSSYICTRSYDGPSQDVKEDILLHVSNIFDPQNMFHIFLKELNYDHEMLLDYLMSKDAGTSCLEYLLRCLHIINDSRHKSVDSSTEWDATTHSSCKRRKVLLNSSNTSEELSLSSPNQSNETLPSLADNENSDCGYKPHRFGVKAVKKAKNCLQLLKRSLENLHRENLFPYNPEALIKRLTKFLELPME